MTDQQPQSVTRRGFVKGTGVLLGSAASGSFAFGNDADSDSTGPTVPQSVLGRTGVPVSRLSIGCAPFQRKHLGVEHVAGILHRGLELGVNYLDVAPN